MIKEYKVLLFLEHVINEGSPGGRTVGLNQQIPNLGSRPIYLFRCVMLGTWLHERQHRRGNPSPRRFACTFKQEKERKSLPSCHSFVGVPLILTTCPQPHVMVPQDLQQTVQCIPADFRRMTTSCLRLRPSL